MSLGSAIQIARSALATSQVGIQIAGNNMANAATPGYTRQVALLQGLPGQRSDPFRIGTGVGVAGVNRQIDEALQRRLWNGISGEHARAQQANILQQLESSLNELTGFDLSSELSGFFNGWSEASRLLESGAVVIEQGDKLAGFIRSLRDDMTRLRRQVETDIDNAVNRADAILDEIATLNATITSAEGGAGTANALRDQRDALASELSTLGDVNVVEDPQGNFDVLVGSTPVVLAGTSRGIAVSRETDGDVETVSVVVEANGDPLPVTGGKIGGLLASRDGAIDRAIAALDTAAAQLIFQVNRLHSTGTDGVGLSTNTADRQVIPGDRTLAFNDPENRTFADLPFSAENGGFYINVTNSSTGASERVFVEVDLDGIDDTGVAGFGDDTTPEDLRAALDGVEGITASWTGDGKLRLDGDTGFTFSFEDDTSGALAVMGVNSFYQGTDAKTIGVRQDLIDSPALLMLGRMEDGAFIENGTALAVAGLQNTELDELGGRSISGSWRDAVQRVGVGTSSAITEADAARVVRESLDAQRGAVSGVSIDEESINLLNYQRQFQAAAQLITAADELLQTLINLT